MALDPRKRQRNLEQTKAKQKQAPGEFRALVGQLDERQPLHSVSGTIASDPRRHGHAADAA